MVFPDEVCQALVLWLQEQWSADQAPAVVTWGYAAHYDETRDDGRKVFVFPDPAGFAQSGVGLRSGDQNDYTAVIVVCERAGQSDRIPAEGVNETAGVPGQPKRDWLTARVRWVMEQVYHPMSDFRDDRRLVVKNAETGEIAELYANSAEITALFDPEAAARGVFRAQLKVTFREQE